MRIWHQSYSDLRDLPGYVQWLTSHARKVLPHATVAFHGLRPSGAALMTPETKAEALVSAATTAEANGYDAFVLGCIYDPALAECRAAVSIPVLALAESVTTLSRDVGLPLGLLVLAPEEIDIVSKLMASYGLGPEDVAVDFVAPEISEPDLDANGRNGIWTTRDAAVQTANELASRGYSNIVAAEGVLNEYLWAATQDGQPSDITDSIGHLWNQTRAAIRISSSTPAPRSEPKPNDGAVEWFAATAP